VEISKQYSAWEYREDSPLREKLIMVFTDMYGYEPVVEAIHAGLECGLFVEKMPDLDAISIGMDIIGAHSPDERMSISSYERTCNFVVKVLEEL
jgi:dipeptidase D